MAIDRRTKMSPEETDAFLGSHETGVMSLARTDEPYAIPISYGYNASNGQFYTRLVSTPESEKRRFLDSNPDARVVVYEADGDTYRSVIATGTLVRIDPQELTVEDVQQYGDAKRPLFEIWPKQKGELDIELYRLDPETLSGRLIEISREK
ncbi:MAG: pyridoxamine 5'-phosphate oxidase family protein [Natronomonas sp.]|uniref:pyridoxamine 5'-phosphate oxidase family protein n=1 Tax=Natronomonas sp. TaxID=2184060 RepID=UPI0028709F37|nr:pyridoxamine 5'-phosphate oxidase family protein [Natronomonas sp.]MDR9381618.1 pyridoxamine 5'-phosphate oxidase family protein [Natronomonas sp.]MDR9429970.1 pyridoxamine 5'-phosphate oxidase family protein [Natronomonas sp.]